LARDNPAVLVVLGWFRVAQSPSLMVGPSAPPSRAPQACPQTLGPPRWITCGSGGFWGLGIGKSREKLFYLPDSHTDFIFSILSEELGFLGTITVISLFAILIIRGLIISIRAQDTFGAYLAMGLTSLIGLQAAINMAVVSGLMPTKGLSLPFLSYGGSSLLVNMISIGILLNISSQTQSQQPKDLYHRETNLLTGNQKPEIRNRAA